MPSRRIKQIAFDAFYKELAVTDKVTYIKSVMDSCKTSDQLSMVSSWGIKVLWEHFDVVMNKYENNGFTSKYFYIWSYCYNRMSDVTKELRKYHNELNVKL